MNIFNKANTFNTGALKSLQSYLLIGNKNIENTKISIQISYVPIDSMQPIHNHTAEQCYYIIKGKGLMVIEDEQEIVNVGDAIHIPSNKKHGIKNIGTEILEYLTANTAFNKEYEDKLWKFK
jgi:mannose-6-phosphate isomerase-like protein (cupin superfamily)